MPSVSRIHIANGKELLLDKRFKKLVQDSCWWLGLEDGRFATEWSIRKSIACNGYTLPRFILRAHFGKKRKTIPKPAYNDGDVFNCTVANLLPLKKPRKVHDSKTRRWRIENKNSFTCSQCGKKIINPSVTRIRRFQQGKRVCCSLTCGASRTVKKWEKWVKENQGKILCVCKKPVSLRKSHYTRFRHSGGSEKFFCSQRCSQPSKYADIRKLKIYCQCNLCKLYGQTEKTRIKTEEFSVKTLGDVARGKDRKFGLVYLSGHYWNQHKVVLFCKICKTEFKRSAGTVLKIHRDGFCDRVCARAGGWVPPTVKAKLEIKKALHREEVFQRLAQIKDGHGLQDLPKPLGRYGRQQMRKIRFVRWCVACETGQQVTPMKLARANRRLPLCKPCAPLSQKRLCFCGLPRLKYGKKMERRCVFHTRIRDRMELFRKGLIND